MTNPLLEELNSYTRKSARYKAILHDLHRCSSNFYQVKGFDVQSLYPPEILRASNDIDLVAWGATDFWELASRLRDSGWTTKQFTLFHINEGLHFLIALERDVEQALSMSPPDRVEIATFSLVGNGSTMPPRSIDLSREPLEVRTIVLLAAERLEQPFRARDLLDAHLSVSRLGRSSARNLESIVKKLDLVPEAAELLRRLVKHSLMSGDMKPFHASGRAVWRARCRRSARMLGLLLKPSIAITLLVRRALREQKQGWPTKIQAALGLLGKEDDRKALGLGLPLFGLGVHEDPSSEFNIEHHRKPDLLVARTPVGAFAMTSQGIIDENVLEAHGLTLSIG